MSLRGKSLWTIGGGKGGVGKSFLAASLGTALARAGKSVVLVDANFAAPDLHAYVGVKNPNLTLLDVLEHRAELTDALIPTPEPGMRFLSCVGDELGMADQNEKDREKMAALLATIDADVVLVDAGNGTTRAVLDFFNLAYQGIVVTSPEAASMRCTYRFIRNAVYRKVQQRFGSNKEVSAALDRQRQQAGSKQAPSMMSFLDSLWPTVPDVALSISDMLKEFRPLLLVNMASSEQEHRSAEMLHSAASKFLNVDILCFSPIPYDPSLRKPRQSKSLPDCGDPDGPLARKIQQAAAHLTAIQMAGQEGVREEGCAHAASSQAMGLNDNLAFMGRALHVQTEDLGAAGSCIVTQVFCAGRVVLSTKSAYPPAARETYQNDHLIELMRNQHRNVIRQIESLQLRNQTGAV
jgi:flagellar biosynthesis protein FlhG